MDKELSATLSRFKLEEEEQWRKWAFKIPFIPLKAGWKVAPIPPFSGAMSRMRVELPDGRVKSIYLDCFDNIGWMGEPYWEVCPVKGDVGRCLLNEVDVLVDLIEAPDGELDE